MSDEVFEVVAREAVPNLRKGVHRSGLTAAVLASAQTGEAVRVTLNGRSHINIFNSVTHAGRRATPPLRIRQRLVRSEGAVYLWAEPKP